MSLTNTEALDVVIGCVRSVGGHLIDPTQSLEKGGIDDARVPALQSKIVADPKLGVKKYGHRLEASVLAGISPDDSAQDVADLVADNATQEKSSRGAKPKTTKTKSVKTKSARRQKRPAARRKRGTK